MKYTLATTGQTPRTLPIARETEWPLYSLQRAVNHIFQDFLGNGESLFSPAIFEEELGKFAPRVDLCETDKDYTVTAELPGMNEKDIEVSISKDMLAVRGEKKEEKEEKHKGYYRQERSYGNFCRTIALPTEIESDKAEATFKNGVLNITLPKTKTAEAQSKKLTVKAG